MTQQAIVASPAARRWWREPTMWLVAGGPAAVVLAGVATTIIAVTRPDPVLAEDYYRRGIEINQTLRQSAGEAAAVPPEGLRPAMQARNHAATPVPAPGEQPR
ncbi:FixH family protein [Aquabacterium sp. A7-Y]|uniref:FixH family protein n=1 Tax=Aquabacterium sp. A7-Y TaxID=1349605 RepID=UPI00223CC828|nr:FixH family protein [Aquabacterium sp. A7-Y]MCW7537780.1 FixH family protein [Aquabacterium sp. A7-Y]